MYSLVCLRWSVARVGWDGLCAKGVGGSVERTVEGERKHGTEISLLWGWFTEGYAAFT